MENRLSFRAWVMLTLMVVPSGVCRDERAEGETCRRSCSVLGICTSMAVTKYKRSRGDGHYMKLEVLGWAREHNICSQMGREACGGLDAGRFLEYSFSRWTRVHCRA
jgi:hypothetical protein